MLSFLSLGLLAAPAVHATGPLFHAPDDALNTLATSNSTRFNGTIDMVSGAWYTGYHNESLPLAKVPWAKYTHVFYSFAETTPTANVTLIGSNPELLPEFVQTARENDVKALVSIGGWTGSIYFSDNTATQENITNFVQSIVDLSQLYDLDGVNFDWEYPGNQGIGCNTVSPNDTDHFLTLLQALREELGPEFLLTASAPLNPWVGPDGTSLSNVSDYAAVLDWVNVVSNNVHGSWESAVGPNAPLNDTCANSTYTGGSAVSALAAWTAAGMPAHQIVLGVAGYGHAYSVDPASALASNGTIQLNPTFNASAQPLGDAWDSANSTDSCGVTSGPEGVFNFWGLIEGGYLNANGSVATGIHYLFDGCSQTSFVYNETAQVMISYDDATSFEAKGAFVAKNNMRGFALWEMASDINDILIDAIRSGAGFPEESDEDC